MPPSSLMATLVARQLTHERGGHTVLDNVSLSVAPGTCLGVVGPNGVGKSTLLQILAGLITPTSGTVRVDPPEATVGYLAQEHAVNAEPFGETVRAALTRRTGVTDAETGLAEAAAELGSGSREADDRYQMALARYESLSAGDFEARLATTVAELGLPAGILERDTRTLSGGQEARIALCAIVLSRFDLTLLDEPTNDLDFDGLERLESLVANRRSGMVIVSHDRAFLNGAVTDVLQLHEHLHTGELYGGGWSGYQAEREAVHGHAVEAYANYEVARRTLKQRAQRERQWATSGVAKEKRTPKDNDKAQRDFRINKTEKLASRARRTERALDTLPPVEKPWEGWDLRFAIAQAPRSGAVVARLEGAVIQRPGPTGADLNPDLNPSPDLNPDLNPDLTFTLGPIDLQIGWTDRVALIGPNGSGKSTLVNAVLGRLPLTHGTRLLGPSVVVGELGQDRRTTGGATKRTVVDQLIASTGLTMAEARSLLAKFGLDADKATRQHQTLSPGERTRAELATFAAMGVNLLVLDEPTNHLDLPAIEQLESALSGFDGTLLLVSHDRRLLETVDLTRRILLPPLTSTFRGIREDR